MAIKKANPFYLYLKNVELCYVDSFKYSFLGIRYRNEYTFPKSEGVYHYRTVSGEWDDNLNTIDTLSFLSDIVFFIPRLIVNPIIHTIVDIFTRKPFKEEKLHQMVNDLGNLACSEKQEEKNQFSSLTFQLMRNYSNCKSINSRKLLADLAKPIILKIDEKIALGEWDNSSIEKKGTFNPEGLYKTNPEELEILYYQLGSKKQQAIINEQNHKIFEYLMEPTNNGTRLMSFIDTNLHPLMLNKDSRQRIIESREARVERHMKEKKGAKELRNDRGGSLYRGTDLSAVTDNDTRGDTERDLEYFCGKNYPYNSRSVFFAPYQPSDTVSEIFYQPVSDVEEVQQITKNISA